MATEQIGRLRNAYFHMIFGSVVWADRQTFQVSWTLDRTSIQKRWRGGKQSSKT